MKFKVPETLTEFSLAGLQDLRRVAAAELTELRASVTDPETMDDATLADVEALHQFVTAADAEAQARSDRRAKFESLTPAEPVAVTEPAGPEKDVSETVVTAPDATVVAATVTTGPAETVTVVEGTVVTHTVADVARVSPSPTDVVPVRNSEHYSLVAAADVSGFASGQVIGWDDLGAAFEGRARLYGNGAARRQPAPGARGRLQHTFAMVQREFPPEQQLLDGDGEMNLYDKLRTAQKSAVANAENSLTAAVGWCAPSETIYSICNPVTADGLLDLPEVQARRGGIRHNRGIDWATFFGGTFPAMDTNVPGMTLLTEAQVEADTAKTCLEIDCPPFVDERLQVAALCLTGSLLQTRGYPEYVSEFTRGAIAAFAHLVNREVIDIIEDGSTAVSLVAAEPWVSDGSVLSVVMSAVEMAVVDMRSRMRLGLNAPIDFVFPHWLPAQMRADYIRRNAASSDDLTDAMIASMFATRGARVQYVQDWQDAFSGVAGGVGALTAITTLPVQVRFLAFPPGTWVLARQDVIRLDTLYDAAGLAQNQYTALFMEDGYLPMRMCPLSRVYTVNICPTGATGDQRAVDCVAP